MTDDGVVTVVEGPGAAQLAAEWCSLELSPAQMGQLEVFAGWLEAEAIPAGGLGPREGGRIWRRHIADSIAFSKGWAPHTPGEILDVGSGVGLPGIPLAIAHPGSLVTVLDRGGRRIRLLDRVVRMLALGNVAIAQGDAFAVADEWEGLVFRSSVTAPEAVGITAKLLAPGGTSVLGLSTQAELPARSADLVSIGAALGLKSQTTKIPSNYLDGGGWLLIMHRE